MRRIDAPFGFGGKNGAICTPKIGLCGFATSCRKAFHPGDGNSCALIVRNSSNCHMCIGKRRIVGC